MGLIKQVASQIERQHWWNSATTVIVAVSTGVDSMTLMNLLIHLRSVRPKLVVAHVNHELRSASWREERYLRTYCRVHHLRLYVAHWPKASHPEHGIENAARQFRYGFFRRVMRITHARVLVTAHHLNDQAETVLMRLIRGGDLNELAGIYQVRPFASGRLIRPLLAVPKAEIIDYAKRHRVKWFNDATNASLAMTRNRMRHLFLPKMKAENPRILFHLGHYAGQLQRLLRGYRFLNLKLINELGIRRSDGGNLAQLVQQPRFIQWGLLKVFLAHYYPQLTVTPQTVTEIVKLFNDGSKPQGQIRLNRRIQLFKNYQQFEIKTGVYHGIRFGFKKRVQPNRWCRINRKKVGLFNYQNLKNGLKKQNPVFFLSKADFPLILTPAQPSDRLRLKGGGHQKVRRILINQKVPNSKRAKTLILKTNRGVNLALLGYKTAFIPGSDRKTKFTLVTNIRKGQIHE